MPHDGARGDRPVGGGGEMTALVFVLVLLVGNAFFVGAEFALIAARRSQIELLGDRRGARTTLHAIDDLSRMMAGAQLGITACSVGLGAVGEPAVAHLLEGPLHALGVPDSAGHPIAFVVALALIVFLHMVVGEMVPKNLALAAPERAALLLGPALAAIVRALGPLISVLNAAANGTLRLFGVRPSGAIASTFTREQVTGLIAESRGAGLLDEDDHKLLNNALSIEDETAADAMVAARDVVTVPRLATAGEIRRMIADTGFSRLPVRGPAPGTYAGYVHVIDVLEPVDLGTVLPRNWIRPLPVVYADAVLGAVLSDLREAGSHLVQVRDAAGATLGVLFFEDVLAEFVGEIRA